MTPKPQKRTTLRDLAAELKIHHSTVSRALKNDERISSALRQQVKEAAVRLSYKPDPMLSALMAYRSSNQAQQNKGALAWLTNYPTRNGWREFQNIDYFNGAARRAEELGYSLDEIWMREPGITPPRLTQILLSRNVQGLLIPPLPRAHARLRLDWDQFAALSFGSTIFWPPLHSVDSDHFHAMATILRKLKKMGYKQPGFVCLARTHESIDRTWTAAFLAFQPINRKKSAPLLVDRSLNFESFRIWFQKHKPDAVITHLDVVADWIKKLGLKIPNDIGFALAAKHNFPTRFSGVDECSERVGEAGVNSLVKMIQEGQKGIPTNRTSILLQGEWVEGKTLRPS
jgi:LacI family transcriptional regulator